MTALQYNIPMVDPASVTARACMLIKNDELRKALEYICHRLSAERKLGEYGNQKTEKTLSDWQKFMQQLLKLGQQGGICKAVKQANRNITGFVATWITLTGFCEELVGDDLALFNFMEQMMPAMLKYRFNSDRNDNPKDLKSVCRWARKLDLSKKELLDWQQEDEAKL